MTRSLGPVALTILLALHQWHASGQTDNYWSWNFNTPSALLAGSVVGGGAGPSAIFYNPALIDHENVSSIGISANIISLQFFNAYDIGGSGIDADRFIFKVQPRFLSFVLPSGNDRWGLEAAILSPTSEEVSLSLQHKDELDVIKRAEGQEVYLGSMTYARKYEDTWIGFGSSYQLSDQLFIGASSFLSIKTLKYEYFHSTQAFQEDDSVNIGGQAHPRFIASSTFEEVVKYWDLSFVFKVGVQWKSPDGRKSGGMSLTVPSIGLIGAADVKKGVSRSNIFDNVDDKPVPNFAFAQGAEGIRTRTKLPFSISLGFRYLTDKESTALSLSAEYFHKIDPYAVIDVPINIHELPDGPFGYEVAREDFMSYYHAARSVMNIGVGIQHELSENLTLMGGFRTDFSSGFSNNIRYVENQFKFAQIHLNKYHLTFGSALNIGRLGLVAGLQYTTARNQELDPIINYSEPLEYIPNTGQSLEGLREGRASAKIDDFSFVIGLLADLNKK